MENEQQHLFGESESSLVQASAGKRFANYLIDVILFYLIVFFVLLVWASNDPITYVDVNDNSSPNIIQSIIFLLFYSMFMATQEAVFKGKSLGKVITGTRAINQDGTDIDAKKALLRGLCRAVPFCVFSALGNPSYPWQDKWTNTYVIDEKLSRR